LRHEFQSHAAHGETAKRDIFVIIDNYDDLPGGGTAGKWASELGDLARRYGTDGLHIVLAGPLSVVRSPDDLVRTVLAARYSLALDYDDALTALGGRIRPTTGSRGSAAFSSMLDMLSKFPSGRGFIVRAGHVSLVQIAAPYESDDPHGSIDEWIGEIMVRNPHRARWHRSAPR
jgi:hypothetical protein